MKTILRTPVLLLVSSMASAQSTSRVSVASDGTQANEESETGAIDWEGRIVVFRSDATNLVPGDTNNGEDVFVHDRRTGQTSRVNVSSNGEQADGESWFSVGISADGRWVAFAPTADNLHPDDENGRDDVFVHDKLTGETSLVSLSSIGSQGDKDSWDPAISADGRYVAFESDASNLLLFDTNGQTDVFIHDREARKTVRVSITSEGSEANDESERSRVSADGRFVAFESEATNLVVPEWGNTKPGSQLPSIPIPTRDPDSSGRGVIRHPHFQPSL